MSRVPARHTRGAADVARRAAAVLGAALAGSSLAACSGDTVPADDEYAGRAATETASHDGDPAYWIGDAGEETGTGQDGISGPYADGTYSATRRYGPINEDSVKVTLSLDDGVVTDVTVVGDALLPQSADYQSAFVAEIEGAVVGRDVDDAHVDVLAGASKTSATFNRAIDDIREQAAAEAQQADSTSP